MAIKFEKIVKGMNLWDVRKAKWPSRRKWSCWPVKVLDVDCDKERIFASWNGNTPSWIYKRNATKLRAKRPENPVR